MKKSRFTTIALLSLAMMIPALASAATPKLVETRAILYTGESANSAGFITLAILTQGVNVEIVGCSIDINPDSNQTDLAKFISENCQERYTGAKTTHYTDTGAVIMTHGDSFGMEPMFPMLGSNAIGIQLNLKSDANLTFALFSLRVPAQGNIESEVTRISARKVGEAKIMASQIKGTLVQ